MTMEEDKKPSPGSHALLTGPSILVSWFLNQGLAGISQELPTVSSCCLRKHLGNDGGKADTFFSSCLEDLSTLKSDSSAGTTGYTYPRVK